MIRQRSGPRSCARSTRLVIVALLCVLAAACGGGAADSAAGGKAATPDAALEPLSFGYQSSLFGAPLILAEEAGFWQDAGLQIESQRFSAGKDVRDALIAGSVDAGSIGPTPFIVAAATGQLAAVAVAGYLGDTSWLVVREDSAIESVEDLRGHDVAAARGSITELIFMEKVLPANGMTPEDVNLRNVTFADQVAALTTGEVDAFVGLEPYVSIAEEQGIGVPVQSFAEFDLLPNILAFSTDFLENNEETAVATVQTYFDATQFIEEDFDEAASILHQDFASAGLQMAPETLSTAFEKVDVNPLLTEELRDYLDEQAQLLMERGEIDQIPDWDEVLRLDIQEQAMTDYWADK
ncbi:MAG: ABC transporter substrate-binding protein [Egibacteraceae bacterium]